MFFMKKIFPIILIILILSFTALSQKETEKNSSKFLDLNISGVIKDEGTNISNAKIIGLLILGFLLISGIYSFKKNKKSKNRK
jgi:hypothetical protein